MKDNITAATKINEIRLLLGNPVSANNIYILVEGEDDCKVYGKLITGQKAKLKWTPGGVRGLTDTLNSLTQETDRVIGIRDADFLHMDKGTNETIQNLFMTDFHDIEMVMIAENHVMQNVLHEHLANADYDIDELRNAIVKSLIFISKAKWLNYKFDYELNFKGFPFGTMINNKNFGYDEEKIVSEINRRSPNKTKAISVDDINHIDHETMDMFQLTNGHDFICVFALFISSKIGKREISDKTLHSSIRLSYNMESFKKTNLFDDLRKFTHAELLFSN